MCFLYDRLGEENEVIFLKKLIPKDEYGIFADAHDIVRVDSLFVANYFEKSHNHVVRDIEEIISPQSGLSEEFNVSNFGRITYTDSLQ